MGGFITSRSVANRHDVYAEERNPPAVVQAVGTGVVGLVGQFPWGPVDRIIKPADAATRAKIIAPRGMSRTGQGYLATIRKGFPTLYLARVLGSAAAKADVDLLDGATNVITITAKYLGASGNLIGAIVTDASDGDANHFNLRVFVEGPSGMSEDFIQNLNYSGVGDDSSINLDNAILIGTITKNNAGRPDNTVSTSMFTGGLDGTINAARYLGTAEAGDFGLALFENDKSIRTVFADDPGDAERAAVNVGLLAHQTLMGDRVAILNGDSGMVDIADVHTDVANYRSAGAIYVDGWVYINDDTDSTLRLVAPSSFAASVLAQTSPSTSPAIKDAARIAMLQQIRALETPRGAGAAANTAQGVMTIIEEDEGGYTFEAGVLTIAPSDPSKKRITRTRMGQYIASSITSSLRRAVDQPNVPLLRQDIVNAVDRFMATLKRNKDINPILLPHVDDYEILPLSSANTQEELDAGDFTIPLNVKTTSGMERIFLSIQYGETVQVTAQAA